MNPAAIIRDATADGVNLTLSGSGKIKASGNREAVGRWLTLISKHKPGILQALQLRTELERLVPAVIRAYGGPPEEETEALVLALADPVAALQSFRLMAADCGLDYEAVQNAH